jgi:hypothetical protein
MIRIAISAAAFEATCATLPMGTIAFEPSAPRAAGFSRGWNDPPTTSCALDRVVLCIALSYT